MLHKLQRQKRKSFYKYMQTQLIPSVIYITNAALPYTEYPLRMLKFEIRAEITEYDANGRGGACTKRCLCESVKNACGSLQMS